MRNGTSDKLTDGTRLAGLRVSPDAPSTGLPGLRWLWAVGFVAACGSTEGPLLLARSAGGAAGDDSRAQAGAASSSLGGGGAGRPMLAAASSPLVQPGMRLHYQLTGEPNVDASAQVFVLDLFDADAAQVASLRALGAGGTGGRIAIAYLSAGSLESWRPDAAQVPDSVVGSQLAGYPDEKWLDVRGRDVRNLMRARLSLARDKGFDGVFPGALGAYRSDSGFPLTQADQLDYDRFLSSEARALGLTPGLSGDFALARDLADSFDWAIAFGCLAADSCDALQPLLDQHKAVYDLEVEGELNTLCPRAQQLGVAAYLKRPAFDAWSRSCP